MRHLTWNLVAGIKNGYLAKKIFTKQAFKITSKNLLDLLWEEGYIAGYQIETSSDQPGKSLVIFLKYDCKKQPALKNVTTLSKPGKRVYVSYKQLIRLNSNNSLFILSTDKGFKSSADCVKEKVGGELLLKIN